MIKRIFKNINIKILVLISSSKWITNFYYSIKTKGFQHEQHQVLRGILNNRLNKNNIGNFRRAIHRIEKGLITQPSKPVFAESYILETVLIYESLLMSNCEKSTLLWAEGILNQYFESVQKTRVILKSFEIFEKLKKYEKDNLNHTFLAKDRIISKISIDDFFDLTKQRRSVRYYQNKPVPRNLLEGAIRVALQSPSACNRQPFSFRVIDDPKIIRTAAQMPNGASTFSEGIPMMIFIIGDLSNYFDERDKHLIYIDGALAAMSFILGLEVQGLSSCVINWSDIPLNNKKLKTFLKLEDWEQCIMSISVGYALPECGIPSSIKKEVNTVIKYN